MWFSMSSSSFPYLSPPSFSVVTVNFADEVLLPNQNDHKLVRVCLSKSASIKHTLEVPLEWLPADAEANSAKKSMCTQHALAEGVHEQFMYVAAPPL